MTLFLLFYFLIYGGVHVFFYFRVPSVYLQSLPIKTAIIVFLVFLVLCPILVRVSERFGYEALACFLSYAGYLWMGLVFLFFAASLLLDCGRALIFMGGVITSHSPASLMPSPRTVFLLPLILSLCVNAYGFFEAQDLRTEKVLIRTAKMPAGRERMRIVQMSDVHVGMIVQGERLAAMVKAVQQAKPDILVSTGDLVDGQIDSIAKSAGLLRSISAPFGKYAVTGNHEFYAGLDQALRFTRDAGFAVLRGDEALAGGFIRLVGVDDPTGRSMGMPSGMTEKNLLASGADPSLFTILLKHQPFIREESLGAFDLQLSGHTHKGQIYPFSLITKLFFPLQNGYHELPHGSALYVSRGTGTWGPPVRFLSPPEVTIIDLVSSK